MTSLLTLYSISLPQPLLNSKREGRNLRLPPLRIVLLEPTQQLLEHRIQLHRGVVPPHDRIAEPKQTLQHTQANTLVSVSVPRVKAGRVSMVIYNLPYHDSDREEGGSEKGLGLRDNNVGKEKKNSLSRFLQGWSEPKCKVP